MIEKPNKSDLVIIRGCKNCKHDCRLNDNEPLMEQLERCNEKWELRE